MMYLLIDSFVFYADFNNVLDVSPCVMGKLPVLPIVMLTPQRWAPRRTAVTTIFKVFGMTQPGIEPTTSRSTTTPSKRSHVYTPVGDVGFAFTNIYEELVW